MTTDSSEASFGERYGWLLGAIWVIFLVYPLLGALYADAPLGWRVVAVGIVLVFGVVYVVALRWLNRVPANQRRSWPWIFLLALIVLAIALIPTIRLGVLGCMPYLVSYSMLALPRPVAVINFVTGVIATIVIPIAFGVLGEWWFIAVIVLLTGFTTLFIRIIEEREAQGEVVREQLTLVAERERVARDVHDVLGHSLTVVTVKAELAERLLDVDLDRARSELRQIQSLTRQALAEVRATVGGLRVARLGEELESAKEALRSAAITADVPDDPDVVDPRYRIIFAWTLREAITNVVRHSRASQCTVTLGEREMTIIDDGVGASQARHGNGLRGIRERVEAASGRLVIAGGADASGTTVKVEM